MVVLASDRTAGTSIGMAVAAGVGAAFLYGIGINLVRRHLTGLPPAAVASATLGSAALLLAPFAAMQWPRTAIPAMSWASAILLGVLCTGLAFVMYYRLIARIGAEPCVDRDLPDSAVRRRLGLAVARRAVDRAMAIAGAMILCSVAISQRAGR